MEALRAYRESGVTGDNPVRLVILLYDQLLRDVKRAIDAFERNDIEARCNHIDHALLVLAQLQGTLDLKKGEEVAANLDRFYDMIRNDLVRGGVSASSAIVKQVWSQLLHVREAWLKVEQELTPQVPATQPVPAETLFAADQQRSSQWKA
jgi:flagellar secretion chaperone FliS